MSVNSTRKKQPVPRSPSIKHFSTLIIRCAFKKLFNSALALDSEKGTVEKGHVLGL